MFVIQQTILAIKQGKFIQTNIILGVKHET